jgi:hypothetical protein
MLDVLVLATIGTAGVIGLLYWPDDAVALIAMSIALIFLYVTVREARADR